MSANCAVRVQYMYVLLQEFANRLTSTNSAFDLSGAGWG